MYPPPRLKYGTFPVSYALSISNFIPLTHHKGKYFSKFSESFLCFSLQFHPRSMYIVHINIILFHFRKLKSKPKPSGIRKAQYCHWLGGSQIYKFWSSPLNGNRKKERTKGTAVTSSWYRRREWVRSHKPGSKGNSHFIQEMDLKYQRIGFLKESC